MARLTLQVFEHATIRVGEPIRTADGREHLLTAAHHRALAAFADATAARYLSCGHSTVRFGAYVGLLQLGELGIEILPKADKNEPGGYGRWHRVLVHMLRVVGDLGLEAPDEARLELEPGRLFDLFIERFVGQCERLLHQGLAKGYRTEESNRPAFRGRLLVTDHIRHNAANAARFYVAAPVYDHRNLPNLALDAALAVIDTLPIAGSTRARARALRQAFPELPPWRPDPAALARFRFGRTTARYRPALRLARLILFHLTPHVRLGGTPLLALLFDMNALWERYVAAIARRLGLPDLEIRTQDARPFWRPETGATRTLRPDLTLTNRTTGQVALVVDTKWKLPTADQPHSADLKQMFCYHELFACPHTLLLYPSTTPATYLATRGRYPTRAHHTALGFLAIDTAAPRAALEILLRQAAPSLPPQSHPASLSSNRDRRPARSAR